MDKKTKAILLCGAVVGVALLGVAKYIGPGPDAFTPVLLGLMLLGMIPIQWGFIRLVDSEQRRDK